MKTQLDTYTQAADLPALECFLEGEEQRGGETHSIQARVGNVLAPVAEVFIAAHAANIVPDETKAYGSREKEIVQLDEATMRLYAQEIARRFNALPRIDATAREVYRLGCGRPCDPEFANALGAMLRALKGIRK